MILDDLETRSDTCGCTEDFERASIFYPGPTYFSSTGAGMRSTATALFALINRDPGRGHVAPRLEAHRKYIDIQYLVAGSEEIGWRPTAECKSAYRPLHRTRDIMFFGDAPHSLDCASRRQVHDFLSGGCPRAAGRDGRQRQGGDQGRSLRVAYEIAGGRNSRGLSPRV